MLEIDGRLGEGGGQVLRTSLSLSALTGRPFHLHHIRGNRSRPGLRPQHLTGVRAVARVCDARLEGDVIDGEALTFVPGHRPRGGDYLFDVAEVAAHGSAGAVTLVWQAIYLPLLFADAPSRVLIRGGTHVPFSPPFHYVAHVLEPALAALGATFQVSLDAWGWMAQGGGQMTAVVTPVDQLESRDFARRPITAVHGVAVASNLPAHIPQRMAARATNVLHKAGLVPRITPIRDRGAGPGAGICLWVPGGGFTALGRRGLPADKVADRAVADLLAFVDNGAAVDAHLADQLLAPLALAAGRSTYTTAEITRHTVTNAALLRQWLDIPIVISGEEGAPGVVRVEGCGFQRPPAAGD